MRNLALVDWDDHDQKAHAEPSDRPTAIEPFDGLRSRLETSSNDKDEAPDKDCPFASYVVTNGTGEASTEEGASREQRDGYATDVRSALVDHPTFQLLLCMFGNSIAHV